jgi:hypothetical protein
MRAIRVGLFTAVLLAAVSTARADVIDFGDEILSAGHALNLESQCPVELCSHNLTSVEFDTNTSGGTEIESGPFEGIADSALNTKYEFIFIPGIHSTELDRRVHGDVRSVPEPGTLLLMGLGVAAAGMLRRRVQPIR